MISKIIKQIKQMQKQSQQSLLSNSDNASQQDLLTTMTNPSQSQQQPVQVTPKTSFYAAMFGMMASALGTGIFNLPLRITEIGIVIFIAYVLLAGIFSYLGCILLQKMIAARGFDSYSEICENAYGVAMKRLAQFCLVVFPWGITICYQVIMPKFIIQLLADVFDLDLYQDRTNDIYNQKGTHENQIYRYSRFDIIGNKLRIILNVVIICTNFMLIQLRDMRILQKLAVIGVINVTYNAVTIFVLLFTGFIHRGQPQLQYHGILELDWSIIEWAIFDSKSFSMHTQALASIIFCYINHQLVFPTCKTMQNATPNRLNACFRNSNISQLVLYIVIGLSGYLLLMEHQAEFPIGPMVLTSINVLPMTIGKTLMISTLYLAVPLNLFPARTILSQALSLQKNTKNHYILSIGLAASGCIIAITFLQVNSYFGLLGGTAGVLIGGGIPALCYYKIVMKNDKSKRNWKSYIMLVFCAIISVLAFIGAILSVVQPA